MKNRARSIILYSRLFLIVANVLYTIEEILNHFIDDVNYQALDLDGRQAETNKLGNNVEVISPYGK